MTKILKTNYKAEIWKKKWLKVVKPYASQTWTEGKIRLYYERVDDFNNLVDNHKKKTKKKAKGRAISLRKKLQVISTSQSRRVKGVIKLSCNITYRRDEEVDFFKDIDKLGEGKAENLA